MISWLIVPILVDYRLGLLLDFLLSVLVQGPLIVSTGIQMCPRRTSQHPFLSRCEILRSLDLLPESFSSLFQVFRLSPQLSDEINPK